MIAMCQVDGGALRNDDNSVKREMYPDSGRSNKGARRSFSGGDRGGRGVGCACVRGATRRGEASNRLET